MDIRRAARQLFPLLQKGAALAAAFLAAGCSVMPEPLTRHEIDQRILGDHLKLFGEQDPLFRPITLADALARAVRYNLDHKIKVMEQAVARGEMDVAQYSLLPALDAHISRSGRSRRQAVTGESAVTGEVVHDAAITSPRYTSARGIGVVLNFLDFGISYARAKQAADHVLITEERRRQAVADIFKEVRHAYWRAVGAAIIRPELESLLSRTRDLLKRSETSADGDPMNALAFQRALMEKECALMAIREEIWTAKSELASLMNLDPGADFELALPAADAFRIPKLEVPPDQLESFALTRRPELREADYRRRIAAHEIQKAWLRLLPGLEVGLFRNVNSNPHLTYNTLTEKTIQVSWNLLSVMTGPRLIGNAENHAELEEMRRLAIGLAVMSQVTLARANFRIQVENYQLAERLADVNGALLDGMSAPSDASVEAAFQRIGEEVAELDARRRRYQRYADLQMTYGQLQAAAGIDPLPHPTLPTDLDGLAEVIEENLIALERGDSLSLLTTAPAPPSRFSTLERLGDSTLPAQPFTNADEEFTYIPWREETAAARTATGPWDETPRPFSRSLIASMAPLGVWPKQPPPPRRSSHIMKGNAQLTEILKRSAGTEAAPANRNGGRAGGRN